MTDRESAPAKERSSRGTKQVSFKSISFLT